VEAVAEYEVSVDPMWKPGDTYNNSATGKEFVVGSIVLPPSEWSPTEGKPVESNIGQPKAANSEATPDVIDPSKVRVVKHDFGNGMRIIGKPSDNYTTLRAILDAAFNHAATGKGKERHARDLPFDEQPMLETTRLVGPGFPLGQAIKKAGEAAGMIERGEMSAAEAECLGAINYLAGAVAWMREQKAALPVAAPTSVGAAA
jgi:hypothetical protein